MFITPHGLRTSAFPINTQHQFALFSLSVPAVESTGSSGVGFPSPFGALISESDRIRERKTPASAIRIVIAVRYGRSLPTHPSSFWPNQAAHKSKTAH